VNPRTAAPPPATPAELIDRASRRTEGVLLEPDGIDLLALLGFDVPRRVRARDAAEIARMPWPSLPGEKVVLKAVSPQLLHKTDAGAVAVLPNRSATVAAAAREMETRLEGRAIEGFLLCEFVPHESGPGSEFLLGLRHTRDFGPVVTLGPGGVHAEFLAHALRDGEALAVFSPELMRERTLAETLARFAPARLATEPQRGQAPRLPREALLSAVQGMLRLGRMREAAALAEFEVNPLVVSQGRLVVLDALGTFARERELPAAPRPVHRVRALLEPRSIAVMGVSEKSMNPGRIILRNVLREGFPAAGVTVIKPDATTIDGCECIGSLTDLATPVDLLVLSVSAPQAAEALTEAAEQHLAESVVLIPGGLDENPDARVLVSEMRDALARARSTAWGGPVVNGGNCLGVRSRPGRFDTLFIPESKLPRPAGEPDPIALVTGSGAFAVSKTSKLADVQPLYTITIGNQMDLTVADYLEYLCEDERVEAVAIYLEGFRPLDGARFVQQVESFVRAGRPVIVYLAGRTAAGAAAAASHTAAVAGDFTVARALVRSAGAVVADTLEDFEDLVRLFTRLRGRAPGGLSLAAVTNAGFEAVAIADRLGAFTLAPLADATRAAAEATLQRAKLTGIVAPRNPMDVTPLLGDAGYEEIVRALLDDPGVDVAVVGCVPMTQALNTLAAGEGHSDDVTRPDGIVGRMARLWREHCKPWVTVVDAGPLYDAMARGLEAAGIPTFRTADRALRLFGLWCEAQRPRD
jgi:acyl-CoA synthetase (NDP forming)